MSMQPTAADSYKGRRAFFGLNVAFVVVMAAAITVGLNFLAFRYLGKTDWTSNAVNSLSPRTLEVLNFLPDPVRLTAVYDVTEGSERDTDKLYARRRDRLLALLRLYQQANPAKVTVEAINRQTDQTKLDLLGKRLSERLNKEAKDHVQVIQNYQKWLLEAQKTVAAELAGFKKALETNKDLLLKNESAQIAYGQLVGLQRSLAMQIEQFKALTATPVWPYTQLVEQARTGYQTIEQVLAPLPKFYVDELVSIPKLDDETKKFLATADTRCKALLDGIPDRINAIDNVPPLKTEEVRQQLAAGDAVVIEMGEDNWVVPESSLWVVPPNARGGQADMAEADFAGEAEITSALVRMSQKNKPVVLFVRHGGPPAVTPDPMAAMMGRMGQDSPEPEYGQLRTRLVREGFEVLEWNVAEVPQQPVTPKAPRQILVVLPPRPATGNPMSPTPQPPRQIGEPQIAAVRKAIENTGRVLLFAGFEQPQPLYPNMPPIPVPNRYETIAKDVLGLKLNTEGLIITAMTDPRPDARGRLILGPNAIMLAQYQLLPGPLTRGLEGAAMVFPLASWISPDPGTRPASQPATEVQDLVVTEKSPNIWACANPLNLVQKQRENPTKGVQPESEDLTRPVAVAASIRFGPEKKHKAVVIASNMFATDEVTNQREPQLYGSRVVFAPMFPGNMEFTLNAIHWLNDSDKTAIPPAASAIKRVKITPEASEIWKIILGGVWPALVLVGGAVAWWVRRK